MGRQNRGLGHAQAEEVAHQRRRPRDRQHVLMGQMYDSRQRDWPVLYRCRDRCGELAPTGLAAAAMRLQHLVLGDLKTQGRQVKYLAGFHHCRCAQGLLAGVALRGWRVGYDDVGRFHLLQRLPWMAFLPAARALAFFAQGLGLGFVQPVRRRRLARVLAVERQSAFQRRHFRGERLHLRKQRHDQCVFLLVA